MAMASDPSKIFHSLRPICTKIAKEPTRTGVQTLQSSLEGLDPGHLQRLSEYVLFPLKLVLQREGISNELKQDAVSCIGVFLRKTKVENFSVFEDLFTSLTVLLSSKEPGKVADLSEELKLAIITCLTSLLNSTALVIRGVMYGNRFLPALGHAISLLLVTAEQDKARQLKIEAMDCLKKLAFCETDSHRLNVSAVNHDGYHGDTSTFYNDQMINQELVFNIKRESGIAMASFLPGISMTLCRIVSGDSQQGHIVLIKAVDIFHEIVTMTLNDSNLENDSDNENDLAAAISSMCVKESHFENESNDEGSEITSNTSNFTQQHYKTKQLRIHKTKQWIAETASKLKILIEKLCSTTIGHANWKVRLSVVNLCHALLMNCSSALQESVPGLVDVLVGLSEDEFVQVSTHSKSCLEEFASQKLSADNTPLLSILEENLHSLLTSLPRLMRGGDDTNKLITLKRANGYLELLGNNIKPFLVSSSHLKRLSHALMQVLELDISDVVIVEEKTPSLFESAVLPSDTQGQNPISFPADKVVTSQFPRYRFQHFRDENVKVALASSCKLLGRHGDLSLLVDNFLELFHESQIQQKQAVFILNEIIIGFCDQGNWQESGNKFKDATEGRFHELLTTIELLIPAYTSDKNWNLPTSNAADLTTIPDPKKQELLLQTESKQPLKKVTSFEMLNSNIQLICLMLEGIGTFARVLGKEFEGFLIETLYLILAKVGDENAAVSRAAYGTSLLICQSLGYNSVEELISRNADYLVNSIALDFKFVFVNRRAPRVLQVMIEYSNADILDIIEDTLEDMFAVMDLYPDELIYMLMKVLHTLVCAIGRWFAAPVDNSAYGGNVSMLSDAKDEQVEVSGDASSSGRSTKSSNESFPQEIFQFATDYYKSKRQALGDVEEEELETADEVSEGDEVHDEEDLYTPDVMREVPRHVKYVTQVLEKCVHFLACKSPVVRLLVLDTVAQSVQAIQPHENDLLPMIHRVWPPITKRLKDSELVVIVKTVNVICTMSECSGDFMRRRVIKDVIPVLLSFMDKQSATSLKAGPGYIHSHACKLQLVALEGLGSLCKQLNINEAELDLVCITCSVYFSSRQPLPLQQACVTAFKGFLSLEPDAVWLLLNQLYCPAVPSPPHPMFQALRLETTESKEFMENVMCFLNKLA